MNIFRLCGDILHLLAFVLLILKIRNSKNCLGIILFLNISIHSLYHIKIGVSMRTQELYLIVFIFRYLDILYNFSYQTYYLLFMKFLFISATAYIIYLMKYKKPYCLVSINSSYQNIITSYLKQSYDNLGDSFPHWLYLLPGEFIRSLYQ